MDIHTGVLPVFGYNIIRKYGETDANWLARCRRSEDCYDVGTNYALAVLATTEQGVYVYRAGFRRDCVRDFCGGLFISSCFIHFSEPGAGYNSRYRLENAAMDALPNLNEICGVPELRHKDVMEFLQRTLAVGVLSVAAHRNRTTILWADKEGGETGKIMARLEDGDFLVPFGIMALHATNINPDDESIRTQRYSAMAPVHMLPVTVRSVESDGAVNRNSGNTCRAGVVHVEWENCVVPGAEVRCDNCGYYQSAGGAECEDCGYGMDVPDTKPIHCKIAQQYGDAIQTTDYLRALPFDEWKNG